jgi:intracellular sulfur oxidation DsrE/DsrF family protein
MMKVLALILSGLLLATPAAAQQDSRYGKVKVMYHVNGAGGDGDKTYMQTLRNVRNHIEAVGPGNADIKIVMHGDGLGMLSAANKNLTLQGEVADLKSTHKVQFLVCKNTLTQRKIDPDKDLFDVIKEDIVPSGVAELSYLQTKGYTYIKP